MHKFILLITTLLEKILMFSMSAIVLTVTWQVFSRFVIQSPSSFTEELARFLLIWIGILGAAYAYNTKAHLSLDLFVTRMLPANQRKVRILIELMVIVFVGTVMIYGGTLLVTMAVELKQSSAALGVNMGLIYSVIPLSGTLIMIFCLNNITQLFKSTTESKNTLNGKS